LRWVFFLEYTPCNRRSSDLLEAELHRVYTIVMGLIGIFIAIVLVVLGMGYSYFGTGSSALTFTNDAPAPVVQGLDLYEDLKAQVNDIKDSEEERVEAEIAELESSLEGEQPTVSNPEPAPQEAPEVKVVDEGTIVDRLMSTGFAVPSKARSIDTIVLHSSYNPNEGEAYGVSELVKIYESYGVSAHYLIDRQGKVYRLVEDKNIAYHAGASKMPDGRKDVNNFSIGIEMMNKEDTQFTKAQYEAVNDLVASLKKKHGIKHVVGHGDIAPTRKTDPWNFDWKKLK